MKFSVFIWIHRFPRAKIRQNSSKFNGRVDVTKIKKMGDSKPTDSLRVWLRFLYCSRSIVDGLKPELIRSLRADVYSWNNFLLGRDAWHFRNLLDAVDGFDFQSFLVEQTQASKQLEQSNRREQTSLRNPDHYRFLRALLGQHRLSNFIAIGRSEFKFQ